MAKIFKNAAAFAEKHGINVNSLDFQAKVKGSGERGTVTIGDVQTYLNDNAERIKAESDLQPLDGGLSRMDVGADQKQAHVVHPGDTTRPPTEEEILLRQPVSPDVAVGSDAPEKQLCHILDVVDSVKASDSRWRALSSFQRYFLVGVKTVCMQVLGRRDENGRPVSIVRQLGFDIETGKAVVAR